MLDLVTFNRILMSESGRYLGLTVQVIGIKDSCRRMKLCHWVVTLKVEAKVIRYRIRSDSTTKMQPADFYFRLS